MLTSIAAMDFVARIAATIQGSGVWQQLHDRERVGHVYDTALQEAHLDPVLVEEAERIQGLLPVNFLRTLSDRLARFWERYRQIVVDETLPAQEVDGATRELRSSVHKELERVRDLAGSLPEGKLKLWWENLGRE